MTTSRHSIKLACFLWFLAVLSILGWIYGFHSSPWWPYFELSREPVTFIRSENRAEDLRNLLWAISFIGGALAAVIALINALRRTRMMQREQDAEIFAKAVEQLGSPERAVRLGAIYALEGLMRLDFNEPARDGHIGRQIGETLAAYIRDRSPLPHRENSDDYKKFSKKRLSVDIEAALLVLERSWPYRHRQNATGEPIIDLSYTDLSFARLPFDSDLRDFIFEHADLSGFEAYGANFKEVRLGGALLDSASFPGASFHRAQINNSNFSNSYLADCDFTHATTEQTIFKKSILNGSKMLGCVLSDTDFTDSQCRKVDFYGSILINPIFDGANISATKFATHLEWGSSSLNFKDQIDIIMKSAVWDDKEAPTILDKADLSRITSNR